MNKDVKVDMLYEVTKQIVTLAREFEDSLHKYYTTYPELNAILTLVLDVAFGDDGQELCGAVVGDKEALTKRIHKLTERIQNGKRA